MDNESRKAPQMEPLKTAHGDVVLIHYDADNHPFGVQTRTGPHGPTKHYGTDYFDFVWSRRFGCSYFHESGGGPLTPVVVFRDDWKPTLWAAACVEFNDEKGASIENLAALGWTRLPAPLANPFEGAIEGRCEYCEICNDWLPDDSLCAHLFEDERFGEVVGPGNAESIAHAKDEVLAAVRRLGCARTLRRGLPKGHAVWDDGVFGVTVGPSRSCGRSFPAEIERDTPAEVGLRWLCALGVKTTKANAAVLAWLDELIAEQDARRASGEACYVVCENRYAKPRRSELMSWDDAHAYVQRLSPKEWKARGGVWIARVVKSVARKEAA